MRPSVRRAAAAPALALVALLGLAACGLSDREQTGADALAVALGGDEAPESEQDSAECVAETWVGEAGTDALVADQVLSADLRVRDRMLAQARAGELPVSRRTAEGYAAAWLGCADFDAIALDRRADHGADHGADASAEQLDEYADCLKEVDDDLWREAIADHWSGDIDSAAATALEADLGACEARLDG